MRVGLISEYSEGEDEMPMSRMYFYGHHHSKYRDIAASALGLWASSRIEAHCHLRFPTASQIGSRGDDVKAAVRGLQCAQRNRFAAVGEFFVTHATDSMGGCHSR